MVAPIAEAVPTQVRCDGEQPGREAAIDLVAPQVLVGADERVVGDVLSIGAVAQEPQAQTEHGLLVAHDDLTPGVHVSLQSGS